MADSDSVGVLGHQRDALATIQHVVIIDMENHTFDNVLGKFCTEVATGQIVRAGLNQLCDGTIEGRTRTGTIPLRTATDVVPAIAHTVRAHVAAIDGGAMDGFASLRGCSKAKGYKCYVQFDPSQIPNIAALASTFALSDRTFEFIKTPSWVGHLVLASADRDSFQGDNPMPNPDSSGPPMGPGWGCDSNRVAQWGPKKQLVPSCVPDPSLDPVTHPNGGAFEPTPVRYVPTIFDRLDGAGLPWRLYAGSGTAEGVANDAGGYGWSICPTFAECLYGPQHLNVVPASDVMTDGQSGTLPALSIVTPTGPNSQHNDDSMAMGDNWLGSVVSAIENGPDWLSTAIFLTWDDCGCFYDHVNPLQYNRTWGIRVPMVIISPYAKPGYTDSSPTTFVGLLAFVEHTFGLVPLSPQDRTAYDFSNAFDFLQTPLSTIPMVKTPIPASERRYLTAHRADPEDPT